MSEIEDIKNQISKIEGDIVGLQNGMMHNYEKLNALDNQIEELNKKIAEIEARESNE